MERKCRLVWNTEAKKLCKYTTKPKAQITKTIDVVWRKHQSTYFVVGRRGFTFANKKYNKHRHKNFGERKCKPATIKKNADQIRQYIIALDDVNTQLSANPIDIF